MNHKEYELETKCRQIARKNGWIAYKNVPDGQKGIPDDTFIHPVTRVVFLVEFKRNDRQKLRPEQQFWAEKYPEIVKLVSNFESFCDILGIKNTSF